LLLGLAGLPLLGWSDHNRRVNGFFGLSNYTGATLYDGWIFFGEQVHVSVTDFQSPGVQTIEKAYARQRYPMLPEAGTFTGDTWNDYAVLRREGYNDPQAQTIMMQAALDSIRKDPYQTFRLAVVKVEEGMKPVMTAVNTYPLPGEPYRQGYITAQYFDADIVQIPALIQLQRAVYAWLQAFSGGAYRDLAWLGALALLVGMYRKPFFSWGALAALALLKVFFPLVATYGIWRYVVSGLALLTVFGVAAVQTVGRFVMYLFEEKFTTRAQRHKEEIEHGDTEAG